MVHKGPFKYRKLVGANWRKVSVERARDEGSYMSL